MGRRIEMALILMLLYSSMVASLAFGQLFTTDNGIHQESGHVEKHGVRYSKTTTKSHEGQHGDANAIQIHIAAGGGAIGGGGRGGGGGGGGGGGRGGFGGGGGGQSGTGNRHQNYMRFIVGGVSISIAYLCGFI